MGLRPAFGTTHRGRSSFLTQRAQLFSDLYNNLFACGVPNGLRVGYPIPGTDGKTMDWRREYLSVGDHTHHYRTVLPNEIVFDVGDDGDWEKCVRDTHALWQALNLLELPYLGALSGGKGTHTHLLGPPQTLTQAQPKTRPTPIGKTDLPHSPPCMRSIHSQLANCESVKHRGRFAIAAYFLNHGYDPVELISLYERTPNYDPRVTISQLNGMTAKAYLPPSCDAMRLEGLCPEPDCRPGIKNPVSWGKRGAMPALPIAQPAPIELNGDYRPMIARYILAVGGRFLNDHPYGSPPTADPLLLHPSEGGRMVREFGAPRSPGANETKVLWTRGPSLFPPLPTTREAAYEQAAGRSMPTSMPRCDWLTKLLPTSGEEGACPQGPQCIPGPGAGRSPWPCEGCPRNTRSENTGE